MAALAVAFSAAGVLGLVGRLITHGRPTWESAREGGGTWQFQLWSMLAPYTLAGALACWVVVLIRHLAR